MKEICEIVGYDYDNATKLRKSLTGITVNGNPMVGYMTNQAASFFVVNPAIFYKGNKLDELKAVIDLFKVKKK